MTENIPELKNTIKISYSLLIAITVVTFILGGIIDRLLGMQNNIDNAKEFALEEVSGLRSDWERAREVDKRLFEIRINNLKEKINNLEQKCKE